MSENKSIYVANWLIKKIAESGDLVTNLKIQKLLYYSEAWSQVINDKELIDGEFQAWTHGPAVPEVYHKFKSSGSNPLPIPDEFIKLSPDEENILNQVLDSYGQLPEKTLENMIHSEDPWVHARDGYDPEEYCEKIIKKEEIKSYFKRKYKI